VLALVLDTSTPAVCAALVRVDDTVSLVAERVVVDGRRHGELLAVGMREVLAAGSPEVIVVGVGPGPFTGLRVGIMSALAFGDARGLDVLGVCSLDGLGAPGVGVATDARRKEVYWAAYDDAGRRCDGPHVDLPDVARAALADRPVLGDGAQLYGFATADLPRYPSLARLAEVALRARAAGEPTPPLTPLYLRRPDAQEMVAR
jgi:tRNA threonylcarbamoyl adenosine modification protein YeaZ